MAHVLGHRQAVRREPLKLESQVRILLAQLKIYTKKTVRANALAVFFLPSRLDALNHKQRKETNGTCLI